MKSILDKNFKYVPSCSTDISKTFARHRKAVKEAEDQRKHRQEVPDAHKTHLLVFAGRKAKP